MVGSVTGGGASGKAVLTSRALAKGSVCAHVAMRIRLRRPLGPGRHAQPAAVSWLGGAPRRVTIPAERTQFANFITSFSYGCYGEMAESAMRARAGRWLCFAERQGTGNGEQGTGNTDPPGVRSGPVPCSRFPVPYSPFPPSGVGFVSQGPLSVLTWPAVRGIRLGEASMT